MPEAANSAAAIDGFIKRWEQSEAAERANYALFLAELCDVINVPRPNPACGDENRDSYVFERGVVFREPDGTTSDGRIDLYKRGCFVLEAKQGSERTEKSALERAARSKKKKRGSGVRGSKAWDAAMYEAYGQAESYAKALPEGEGWPPFLIVVDVGHCIELYSDFGKSGKPYLQFPDAQNFRIPLSALRNAEIRERLQLVWTDPLALDPSKRAAQVTRKVAEKLAVLATSLEEDEGNTPERVAAFLMRCLFTMFAEDVGLLPRESFKDVLKSLHGNAKHFAPMAEALWRDMDKGGFSAVLRVAVLRFNGGLFENPEALSLNEKQLSLLQEAAEADWKAVEPAIFGTLLERALDSTERHKLGAHYTPRDYVERLVRRTVVEPLRDDWDAAKAAAVVLARQGKLKEARDEVRKFHKRLCETRVLDPACGSGNFLYVTLEHLKRLEGEVLKTLEDFGEYHPSFEHLGVTVDPHQLLGIELNPRAAAITDMVLWIGYLQWHFRTRGSVMPPEPVLQKFQNIQTRDAIIDSADGLPLASSWPKADFIVGNPPFLGKVHHLDVLGVRYAGSLRKAYAGQVPDGADLVMYWWHKAAQLVAAGKVRRFGLITTKSITQPTNRRVVANAFKAGSVHFVYAIPNHPWVESSGGADVRIAMTVLERGEGAGRLAQVVKEKVGPEGSIQVELKESVGVIFEDLKIGVDIERASRLKANRLIAKTGLILGSRGFVVSELEAARLRIKEPTDKKLIFPLRHGKDLTDKPRNVLVIDTSGWTEDALRSRAPEIYQLLRDRVYAERQKNRDPRIRENWWLFRRTNEQVRRSIKGLPRYIATSETSAHRIFFFLSSDIKPEHKLVVIGSDDAFLFAVLSSRIHVTWALATGGRLGVGDDPVYSKNVCFEKFPFPVAAPDARKRIAGLGEKLHEHRRKQQEEHPDLTATEMYNVLQKLRNDEPLVGRDKEIHAEGLISVLRSLHDEIDATVSELYGLKQDASDDEVLNALLTLNEQRVKEEEAGQVRWLRRDLQEGDDGEDEEEDDKQASQGLFAAEKAAEYVVQPQPEESWPKTLAEQAQSVRRMLEAQSRAVTAAELARRWKGARVDRVGELLDTLATLGQIRRVADDRFAP